MEKFLANLYREEMEKQAAADFEQFLDEQPLGQLEVLLGLRKHAVAEVRGDVEAPLPDSLPGHHLDAKMKLLDQFVAKSRGEEPPTRVQASEVGHSNFGGPSTLGKKISPHHPSDGKAKEAMVWADRMGRKLAAVMIKQGYDIGPTGHMAAFGKEDEFTSPEAQEKATALATAAKVGQGSGMERRKALVRATANQMQKGSQGLDMGAGDGAGVGLAGQGGGQGITSLGGLGDAGVGTDKTTLASARAKIAAMALRATEGAPGHIKRAAAMVAGRQIAKLAEGEAAMAEDPHSVVPETYHRGQLAQADALSHRPGSMMMHPRLAEEVQRRSLKGLGIGALIGGGLGAAGGALAGPSLGLRDRGLAALAGGGMGALVGMTPGALVGQIRAQNDWLREKGIEPTWGGLGRGRFTPEAAEKYLKIEE